MIDTGFKQIVLLLLVLLASATIPVSLAGQDPLPDNKGRLPDTTRRSLPPLPTDSLLNDSLGQDTLQTESNGDDSLEVSTGGRSSGIDTIIAFSARKIINDVKTKKLILIGEADLVNGRQHLTAHYIEVDLDGTTLYARAAYDSVTGKYTEVPVFNDNGQEIVANEITYNFETKQATLAAAETQFDDGFYYGAHINRVTTQTIFIEDGKYTTCDAPHKHFYFESPRMKIVEGDKIFADQVTLFVADVPIFYLPFGLYFANTKGVRSGIILPSVPYLEHRGVALAGLGFFWAGNEYVNSTILSSFYSKGGYTFTNTWRARVNSIRLHNANLSLTYSKIREDTDAPFKDSYIILYGHAQDIGRRTNITGRINFSTENAIRSSTSQSDALNRIQDITTQTVESNIALTTSTSWGLSFITGYSRSQNIITNELTSTVPVSISLPSWTPFASTNATTPGILDKLTLGYSGRGNIQWAREGPIPNGGFRTVDLRRGFGHQPTISYSFSLANYFTFQPSFSYTENWFNRRMERIEVTNSNGTDTIQDTFENGFFRVPFMQGSVSVSTRLYGIIQPKIFGINAIRHTFSPQITARYSPDYTNPDYGYYRTYSDSIKDKSRQDVRYYVFQADQPTVSGAPPTFRQESISLTIANSIEAKIAQRDTLPDLKVNLLTLTAGVTYNAAAPNNFRWDPINTSASTNLGAVGQLSGNASFDVYDTDSSGTRIPTTLLDNNKGLFRVTSLGLQISTSFSDQGFTTGAFSNLEVADSSKGRRSRFDFEQIPFNEDEFFGESVRGQNEFRPSWEVNLTAYYNITPDYNIIDTIGATPNFSLNTNFSFSLTPTTRIESSGDYNFSIGKFLIPSISVVKDLHCWEMSFTWRPGTGYTGGFYFKLGLKASQLEDIKLEKKSGFY